MLLSCQSQSYVTTEGQTASLSWLIWGALSDERTGLSIAIPAVARQRSYYRVRVPRDPRPYFTVSDLRLPQPGGPGPDIYTPRNSPSHRVSFSLPSKVRRATVEVFEPPPRWLLNLSKFKLYCDRRSVGQFVLVSGPLCGRWPDFKFLWMTITFFLLHVRRPLWRENGSVICSPITHMLESRRTHNHILLSHLRLTQPGGPGPCIYIPQEQGCPVIPLGIGVTWTFNCK
jgi:hypothetical protein